MDCHTKNNIKKHLTKELHATFFASGSFTVQRGFKKPSLIEYNGEVFPWPHKSIGKFSKGGAGSNRSNKNLLSVDECFGDLDPVFEVSLQQVIDAFEVNRIPLPNWIVKTPSVWHYQTVHDIPEWDMTKKKNRKLWLIIQRGLFNLLAPLGADSAAMSDPTRYRRNEHSTQVKVVFRSNHRVTLRDLYQALKRAGFIETSRKENWPTKFSPDYTPLHVSRSKVCKFLKANQDWCGSYNTLAQLLNVSLRTLKFIIAQLKREGKIETRLSGKGRTRQTIFHNKFLGVHIKERFNSFPPPPVQNKGMMSQILSYARLSGIEKGARDVGFFIFALFLKLQGVGKSECERILRPIFDLSTNSRGDVFSEREFLKCVESAYKPKYRYFCSRSNGNFQKLLAVLGQAGLDLEKARYMHFNKKMSNNGHLRNNGNGVSSGIASSTELDHGEICDCSGCVGENVDLDFPFSLEPSGSNGSYGVDSSIRIVESSRCRDEKRESENGGLPLRWRPSGCTCLETGICMGCFKINYACICVDRERRVGVLDGSFDYT